MLYLIWGLLNIGFIAFYIIMSIRMTKAVHTKMGLLAAFFFVFVLMSFIGASNDKNNKETNSDQTWNFAFQDSLNKNATTFLHVELEESVALKFDLRILYGKSKNGQLNIPLSAYSSNAGFVSGTKWKPTYINVNRTGDNNKFKYVVEGIFEWKLLGVTIFSQSKEFKGIASLK